MRQGYTLKSFAVHIGCSRDSMCEWADRYPEFSDAIEMVNVHSLYFLKRIGIEAVRGCSKGFKTSVWVMMMKNHPLWRTMGQ